MLNSKGIYWMELSEKETDCRWNFFNKKFLGA